MGRAGKWPPHSEISSSLPKLFSHEPVKTGVRIEVLHPKHGWQRFTIRDDYDFARGKPPAGKGYHVNVELPGEKVASCWTDNWGRRYVENLWDYLSQRVSAYGEKEAAQWYMNKNIDD